jgi:hypothetical protein
MSRYFHGSAVFSPSSPSSILPLTSSPLTYLSINMPTQPLEGDSACQLTRVYPDGDNHKPVVLFTSWNTAFICWENQDPGGAGTAHQIIQHQVLESSNQCVMVDKPDTTLYKRLELGEFTRGERDRLLLLAEQVDFGKHLTYNACRGWMKKLLQEMLDAGLIYRETLRLIHTSPQLAKDNNAIRQGDQCIIL